MKRTSPDDAQSNATISTSRRNFIKGAQLALGAGVAVGISAAFGRGAHALGSVPPGVGNGHCFLAGTRIQTASGLLLSKNYALEMLY